MSLRHVGQGRFPLFEWGWLWSQDVMHLRQKKWPHCRQGGQRARLTAGVREQALGTRRGTRGTAAPKARHAQAREGGRYLPWSSQGPT